MSTNSKTKNSGENRKTQSQKFMGSKKSISERRKIVYTLDLRGHSNQEISDALGVSLSTVEKDLHEYRENIRDWFSDIGSEERFLAFVDATIHLNNVQRELWQMYAKEEDQKQKLKILFSIADNAMKKANMFNTPESFLTEFYFKQKDISKDYLLKEKFIDLAKTRIC